MFLPQDIIAKEPDLGSRDPIQRAFRQFVGTVSEPKIYRLTERVSMSPGDLPVLGCSARPNIEPSRAGGRQRRLARDPTH